METVRLYMSMRPQGVAGCAAVQLRLAEKYPDLAYKLQGEKRFVTEPAIASSLLPLPSVDERTYAFLNQLQAEHLLAWYEDVKEPASLRWMYCLLLREDRSQAVLSGLLHILEEAGTYEIRVLSAEVRLTGINDMTGVTGYSAEARTRFAALRFTLKPGERLMLWCRKREGKQEAVARALLYLNQEGGMQIKAVDGIDLHLVQRSLYNSVTSSVEQGSNIVAQDELCM